MRRAIALVGLLVLAWSSSALWLGAAAGTRLHRARAEAVALHGFYDHEGLVPVPLLNLSVPYTRAVFEPGPASEALGSFAWEREAASLGSIMCALSGNELCDLPGYPFEARASHPPSGEETDPPTLTIDEEGSPLLVRAAHERASASATGSGADADVARFRAIPMSDHQAAAAGALAAALSPASGLAHAPSPWLLAVRSASAESETRAGAGAVVATASATVHGVELLGGLVTVASLSGLAKADSAGGGDGEARAEAVGIRVGDLRARVGPGGLRIADRGLEPGEAESATRALRGALEEAGLRLSRGERRVETEDGTIVAEAWALEASFRRQVLPDELPEGTTGDDVIRVPLGWARAEASTTEVPSVEVAGEAPPPPASDGVPPGAPAVEDLAPAAVPESAPGASLEEEAPIETVAAPASHPVAMGVPPAALAGVVAGAIVLLVGLTWLKIAEVLLE